MASPSAPPRMLTSATVLALRRTAYTLSHVPRFTCGPSKDAIDSDARAVGAKMHELAEDARLLVFLRGALEEESPRVPTFWESRERAMHDARRVLTTAWQAKCIDASQVMYLRVQADEVYTLSNVMK